LITVCDFILKAKGKRQKAKGKRHHIAKAPGSKQMVVLCTLENFGNNVVFYSFQAPSPKPQA
jgi:hypothetical protein